MRRASAAALPLVALAACSVQPRQVSDSGFGAYEVSLAAWSDALAVAWYDTRDGNAEIYVRFLDAQGRAVGADERLTRTPAQSYEADLAALDDGLAVAWYEKADDGALRAQLGFWGRDRQRRWTTALTAGGGASRNPVVRAADGALFCAWIESDGAGEEHVWAGWWERNGASRGAPVRLGAAGRTTWNLNAAIAGDGTALVVFDAGDAGAEELYLAELAGGRVELTRLTAADGRPSKYPDIALGDGLAAITWFDERDGNQEVYLAIGPLAELRGGLEGRARRVTTSPGHSIGAYLAWNGPRLGLAWSDDSDGSYEVYFQPFGLDGPLAAPRRLTSNATDSLIPAIRPWRERFALAWNEVAPGPRGAHDARTRSEVMFALAPWRGGEAAARGP